MLNSSVGALAYSVLTVDTQFEYSVSNPAWLKSLIVNENMLDVNGITANATLVAKPEYAYSKTPDSFRSEVEYYVSLYTLDETAKRAGYVYVLDYLNKASSAVSNSKSDEEIKEWLELNGIVYPSGGLNDTETLIFARTLYSLMSSNTLGITITPGTTLEAALVVYVSEVFGDDIPQMMLLNDGLMPETFDEYVALVCIVALNANGFSVSTATPMDEIYRLTAVQTIRTAGVAVDEDTATFEEIQNDFMAVMLGKQYDITVDTSGLMDARATSSVPLFILRTMGNAYGITVGRNADFNEAFNTVAANTPIFSFDTGGFYSDIYNYEAQLSYIRDKVWISATALHTPSGDETLKITIDGVEVQTGEYKEIALNTDAEIQTVQIKVEYASETESYTKTYSVNIRQGNITPAENEGTYTGNSLIGIAAGNTAGYVASIFPVITSSVSTGLIMPDVGTSDAGTIVSSLITGAYDTAIGIQAAINTQNNSLTNNLGGTLLSRAADPPEGYEFTVNEKGYVTGIVRTKNEGVTAHSDGGLSDVSVANGNTDYKITAEMIKGKIPYIAAPLALAVIAVILSFLLKDKKDRR